MLVERGEKRLNESKKEEGEKWTKAVPFKYAWFQRVEPVIVENSIYTYTYTYPIQGSFIPHV